MGYSVIKGPRELHSVRSEEDYLAAHAKAIAARARTGPRLLVHDVLATKSARVDWDSGWIVDCECHAGVSVDPEWSIGCCFACGAVHRDIVFPVAWSAIEKLLIARPLQKQRAWAPGETIADLQAQNRSIGVSDATE